MSAAARGADPGGAEAGDRKVNRPDFSDSAAKSPNPQAEDDARLSIALGVAVDDDGRPRVPGGRRLGADEARALTDRIRADAQTLWIELLRAFEGGAHLALGYSSWAAYCAAEFQFGRARSYQLLNAGRVAEIIQSTIVDSVASVTSEAAARELAPLLAEPHKLREIHAEIVARAPRDAAGAPVVTAKHIRERAMPPNSTEASPSTPQRSISLSVALQKLRRAVDGAELAAARAALEAVRRATSGRRFYTSTKYPSKAFADLIACIAILLGRQP